MLLSLSTTHVPATDLGYLLHKSPGRVHSFSLSFGQAHLAWPEATEARATAALLLDVDTVELVRGETDLDQYVSERPWVASSFLSVAIAQVLGSALAGRSRERPELAATAIPLVARLPTLPCRGGEALLRGLFEPLGYALRARALPLDEAHPDWGPSHIFDVEISATVRLADLLSHLYVLVPVLDDRKHYYVSEDEIEKLLRHGERWLAGHPLKEVVTRRYLARQQRLTRIALQRLAEGDPDGEREAGDAAEAAVERPLSLAAQRHEAVLAALAAHQVQSVADLGCGEGQLLRALLRDRALRRLVGVDVSVQALRIAARRLDYERMTASERERFELLQGSVLYKDARLRGLDAVTCVEVIEHLEPERVPSFAAVLFGWLRPRVVVLTTPNAEYNVLFPALPAGRLRHGDHRFEWDRAQLRAWAEAVAEAHGYRVELGEVGPPDPEHGAPTQLATFVREA